MVLNGNFVPSRTFARLPLPPELAGFYFDRWPRYAYNQPLQGRGAICRFDFIKRIIFMGTSQGSAQSKIRATISGWTAEVGAAHGELSSQLLETNAQLGRLLEVLLNKVEHTA